MKKTKFIVLMLITLLIIIFPLTTNTRADLAIKNPEFYNQSDEDKLKKDDVKDMYEAGGKVAGVIQVVGTAVSVGTMIILGIRYTMASVDEKAEYKERLFPYLIGAVLLFGASNIVNIVYKMFSN